MGTFTFDPLDFAAETNLTSEGWQRWDTGSIPHTLIVEEAGGATPLGDRYAHQSYGTSGALHIFMWTGGPSASRMQVRALLRRSSLQIMGVGGRLESDPEKLGYGATLRNNADDVRWVRVDDGVYNDLGDGSHGFTIGVDIWFWVLSDFDGSSLKMKVWPDGETEPVSWQLERTDAIHAGPGVVGFGAFNGVNTAGQSSDLGWLGVGTDGDAAPEPGAVAGIAHARTIRSTTVGTLS